MNKLLLFTFCFALILISCKEPKSAQTLRTTPIENRASEHHVFTEHKETIASKEMLSVEQPDKTVLKVQKLLIGKIYYFETIEGYTLLKNSDDIYEYAVSKEGKLMPSGVKAHNFIDRTKKEFKFLENHPKHLR